MRIPVFAIGSDPTTDQSRIRKSLSYCQAEVNNGRAEMVDDEDIRKGIRLLAPQHRVPPEPRGSREQSGMLTAYEMRLNAEYLGTQSNIHRLSVQYEHALDKHIQQGRKGLPRQCGVIAARVKTILSKPVFA